MEEGACLPRQPCAQACGTCHCTSAEVLNTPIGLWPTTCRHTGKSSVQLEAEALVRIEAAVSTQMEAALASTEFAERVAVRLKEERARLEAAMLEQLEVEKNALLERKRAAQEAARKAAEDLDRLLEENRHAHPGLQGRGRWLGKSAVMNAARTADVHGGGGCAFPACHGPPAPVQAQPNPRPFQAKSGGGSDGSGARSGGGTGRRPEPQQQRCWSSRLGRTGQSASGAGTGAHPSTRTAGARATNAWPGCGG